MIGVYIRPESLSVKQYKSLDEQMRATGTVPTGMKLHTCFGEGDGVAIFDVWESQEHWDAFAAVLGPIVAVAGFKLEPMIVEMIAFETA
jgi:hypothetical protein